MDWTWGWTAVEALATCIVAGGIGVAIWQIIVTRESTSKQIEATRRSTNAQIAVYLFRELRDPERKKTIRNIIYQHDRDEIEVWLDDDKRDSEGIENNIQDIDHVLDWFDLLGGLVTRGIVDDRLAIDAFAGRSALRCWYQLAAYIRRQQRKRGAFAENYEDFAHRAWIHFRDRRIRLVFRNKHVQINDLGKEFEKRKESKYRPRSLEEIDREKY